MLSITSLRARENLWFEGFIVLLALLPLPFGSNRPWASDLFGVVSALLLLGFCWKKRAAPLSMSGRPPLKMMGTSLILMGLFFLWTLLQYSFFTPASLHHPLWTMTSDMTLSENGAISIDPDAFQESFIRLLGYTACFLLSFFASMEGDGAKKILRALCYITLGYAAYGLLMHFAGSTHVLWFRKWIYDGFLTSTFINKNSYATYAGLGLLCSFGLLWQHIKHMEFKDVALARQSRFIAWLQQFNSREALYCLLPLILLGSIVLSGSRAGLSSTLIGCLVFCFGLAVNRRWKWPVWLALGVLITALLIGAVALGGERIVVTSQNEQFNSDAMTRINAYLLVQEAILNNPWLGLGLGSFDNAFRLYRDSSLCCWFQHAHNDYLELALEVGIPAALIFLTSIALLVFCCIKGVWQRRRHEVFPVLALSATALVSVHSLTDFSLQMPAVAATYAALLGMGVAQSWSTRNP